MQNQIIGIKQLHKELKEITNQAINGSSFVAVRNSKPVFRIELIQKIDKKYTLSDFKKLQFKSGKRNLSQNIDKIIYGK